MLKHHCKQLGGIVCTISAKSNYNMCARQDFYVAWLRGATPSHKMMEPSVEGEGESTRIPVPCRERVPRRQDGAPKQPLPQTREFQSFNEVWGRTSCRPNLLS